MGGGQGAPGDPLPVRQGGVGPGLQVLHLFHSHYKAGRDSSNQCKENFYWAKYMYFNFLKTLVFSQKVFCMLNGKILLQRYCSEVKTICI